MTATVAALQSAEARLVAAIEAQSDAIDSIATSAIDAATRRVEESAIACQARLTAAVGTLRSTLGRLVESVNAFADDLLAGLEAPPVEKVEPVPVQPEPLPMPVPVEPTPIHESNGHVGESAKSLAHFAPATETRTSPDSSADAEPVVGLSEPCATVPPAVSEVTAPEPEIATTAANPPIGKTGRGRGGRRKGS